METEGVDAGQMLPANRSDQCSGLQGFLNQHIRPVVRGERHEPPWRRDRETDHRGPCRQTALVRQTGQRVVLVQGTAT